MMGRLGVVDLYSKQIKQSFADYAKSRQILPEKNLMEDEPQPQGIERVSLLPPNSRSLKMGRSVIMSVSNDPAEINMPQEAGTIAQAAIQWLQDMAINPDVKGRSAKIKSSAQTLYDILSQSTQEQIDMASAIITQEASKKNYKPPPSTNFSSTNSFKD